MCPTAARFRTTAQTAGCTSVRAKGGASVKRFLYVPLPDSAGALEPCWLPELPQFVATCFVCHVGSQVVAKCRKSPQSTEIENKFAFGRSQLALAIP